MVETLRDTASPRCTHIMNKQTALPLPFPDPARDFLYAQIPNPAEQRRVIRETIAKRMALIWRHTCRCVYSGIPGFSRENRSSGVYWFPDRSLPTTHLFAEFAPTRKFYALLGIPIAKHGQFQREKGLCLRVSVRRPIPELGQPSSVSIRLFIERSRPVKCLMQAWSRNRS
jgi:hypothetical protein